MCSDNLSASQKLYRHQTMSMHHRMVRGRPQPAQTFASFLLLRRRSRCFGLALRWKRIGVQQALTLCRLRLHLHPLFQALHASGEMFEHRSTGQRGFRRVVTSVEGSLNARAQPFHQIFSKPDIQNFLGVVPKSITDSSSLSRPARVHLIIAEPSACQRQAAAHGVR